MEKATYDLKKIEHGEALSRAMHEAHQTGRVINQEQSAFVKKDDVDGEWLSPVATERAWQEEQLVNIFGHYPNASPRWQYMNGLIQNSLQAERMYSEEEVQELLIKALTHKDNGEVGNLITVQSEIRTANFYNWFEQFKKK